MAKLKSNNRFNRTKIKILIQFMAKYTFTLYLIHFVIEYLIFCLYVTFEIKCSIEMVFICAFVISNILAIVIAYPTEMRYRDIAKFLNGQMEGNYTKIHYIHENE